MTRILQILCISYLAVLAIVVVLKGLDSPVPVEAHGSFSTTLNLANTYKEPEKISTRESITFIMGEDKEGQDPYYSEATQYYRNQPKHRTEFVIDTCRTLLSVRNYLQNHSPSNGQPWGLINMVLHSNEWIGLSTPVMPGGKRATIQTISDAITTGSFTSIPDQLMDAQTEIRIHGCALGRNKKLLHAISLAFGGHNIDDQLPVVRSSRYFIRFETKQDFGRTTYEQQLVDFRYAFYKTDHRPNNIVLVNQLKNRYPNDAKDWEGALTRSHPRWLGDSYHHSFRIPVIWTVTYPDKTLRPDLEDKATQISWLMNQVELLEVINRMDIRLEYFNWEFQKISYTFQDGTTEPAIKAVGFCTVLCILETLTAPGTKNTNKPVALEPEIDDEQYYGIVKLNISMDPKAGCQRHL